MNACRGLLRRISADIVPSRGRRGHLWHQPASARDLWCGPTDPSRGQTLKGDARTEHGLNGNVRSFGAEEQHECARLRVESDGLRLPDLDARSHAGKTFVLSREPRVAGVVSEIRVHELAFATAQKVREHLP